MMRPFFAIAGFLLALMILSPGAVGAMTLNVVPTTVSVGQNVTATVNETPSYSPCPMTINFGDGTIMNFDCIAAVASFCNLSFSHAYNGTGTYTVSGSYGGTCGTTPYPPDTLVNVTAAPCTPVSVVTSVLSAGTVGQFYSSTLVAGGGNPPLTWSLTSVSGNVLPPGLVLSPTGLISGTPTTTGTRNVSFTVTSTCMVAAITASRSFSLTINPESCPSLVMVSAANLPTGQSGQPYSRQLLSSGGTAPVTWALSPVAGDPLPTGLTLTSSGLLTGVPSVAGTWNIYIMATDNCASPQTVSRLFSLTINPAACPSLVMVSTAQLSAGQSGQPYTRQLLTSGGTAPVTWSLSPIAGDPLPTGLILTSSGMLTGVPSVAGTWNVNIMATDSCAIPQTVSRLFSIVINQGTCPPLTMVTAANLSDGQSGQPYSRQLLSSGGTAPVSWSLTPGSGNFLPTGLMLTPSGMITGVPTAVGTYNVNITATDSCATGAAPQMATRTFTLTINPASSSTITLSVSSPMISIQRRTAATQGITYRATATGATTAQLYSDHGVFMAGGSQIGVSPTPVTIPLIGMTGVAMENLVIPVTVSRRAEEAGQSRMTYQRIFSGGNTTLTTEIEIFLATDATADFKINRLQLSFDNGRAETTVKRNHPGLQLTAEIRFTGSGLLQGFWEVDGRILSHVNQHLAFGQTVTLKTPATPAIPTFVEGPHRARLVITSPVSDFTLPEAIYYVTSEESMAGIRPLRLLKPRHLAQVPYEPISFSWEDDERVEKYLIEIFEGEETVPVASAYTRKAVYNLPESILQGSLISGKSYFWRVKGFDRDGNQVAESPSFRLTFQTLLSYLPGRILLFSDSSTDPDQLTARLQEKYKFIQSDRFVIKALDLTVHVYTTDGDVLEQIAALGSEPGVVMAQPDYIFRTLDNLPREPLDVMQSISKILNTHDLHKHFQGAGIKVAIIDTGIDPNHQDLKNRVLSRYNLVNGSDDVPELHGTAVAGIIAAELNGLGMSGLAPASKLLALRACRQLSEDVPEGECYSSSISRALDIAIQDKAHIVNMSYGASQPDQVVSKLLDAGQQQGMLFVAPVGNSPGQQNIAFPASHPAVIAVGGIDEQGRPYPNAVLAAKADVIAPSENIFTTTPGNRYNFISGTSFSSATISGLLAVASGKAEQKLVASRLPVYRGDLCRWQEELLDLHLCREITAQQ
ncbi:MAG: S8 family serine peptidase [Proteobacteria bacterium]|nr:S8 family serine peptidase [Pseudomonadota bacterium]MBU1716698.1 S8 family serine peptidase [Pseudomonadota bacterium]